MSSPSQVVAWVGLDWADQRHQVACYDVSTGQTETRCLEQKPEALHDWLDQLRQRYGGKPVGLVLEQARGAVMYALMRADFLRLYPVNPQALAHYRKAYATSRAKSDASDAVLLMQLVRDNPQRFRCCRPEDADTRSLRLLTENRRQLVNQKTAFTNHLTALLKTYYPQALELAGELDSPQAWEFLQKWPSLQRLQQARPAQIRKLYAGYGRPRPEQIEQRLEQIRRARPLTEDAAALLSGSLMVETLVEQLRPLQAAIERLDLEIAAIFRKHPDRALFESFPGNAAAVGHCPGHRAKRPATLGALAPGLSEVSATDLSGVCRTLSALELLGQSLLPTSAAVGQRSSRRAEGSGLQMDSHSVSLLENSQPL
jgi:transposase